MATEMSQIKATANAHMRRDMEATRQWVCECEPCREMRSLVGMEKLLDVRPLVREIGEVEEKMRGLPAGAEMTSLLEQYLALQDKLADVMAK
jgi:hypothetical protein